MDMQTPHEQIQEEVQANRERGWGNARTWIYIAALIVGFIVTSAIIYKVVGRGTAQDWNLGAPPTGPNFIAPLW